jgi:DNA-binding transcriptional LysR family regulator
MFARLFAASGLSLDRLRALVEVGAAGSITKAAGPDPVRQSQYSRQIKELEGFFQAKLVERHGKGIRLTAGGRELARISRFFLLGLSNFQRGCLAEEQTFRIGAGATFIDRFLLPVLGAASASTGPRHAVEIADNLEIERRLHDLTLDFGVVTTSAVSRPLQIRELGSWPLRLWVPKTLCLDETQARLALKERRLPFVVPARELALADLPSFKGGEPRLVCTSFLEAKAAIEGQSLAGLLPEFLAPESDADRFLCLPKPGGDAPVLEYCLVWNPRLLRLNPHAGRRRDFLITSLRTRMAGLLKPARPQGEQPERRAGHEQATIPPPRKKQAAVSK